MMLKGVEKKQTRGQSANPKWHRARMGLITASRVGTILAELDIWNGTRVGRKPRGPEEKRTFTRQTVGLDPSPPLPPQVKTACMYGQVNESVALEDFASILPSHYALETECGLHLNSQFPVLGCSPDGLLRSKHSGEVEAVVEVKCPYSPRVRDYNGSTLDFIKSQKHLKSTKQWYLRMGKDDMVEFNMKNTQGMKYWHQVQFSMFVLGLDKAVFVVWKPCGGGSPNDRLLVVNVKRVPVYDHQIIPTLLNYYQEHVASEVEAQRQVRRYFFCHFLYPREPYFCCPISNVIGRPPYY